MIKKSVTLINDSAKLSMLIEYLFSPSRRNIAVVVTTKSQGIGPCAPTLQMQETIEQTSQVFLLSPQLLRDFNEALKNVFGIVPAGVRFYKPTMTLADHHLRHPVWNEAKVREMLTNDSFYPALARMCVAEVKRFEHGRDTFRPQKQKTIYQRDPNIPKREILRISLG